MKLKLITIFLFITTFLNASTDILTTSQIFIDKTNHFTIETIQKAKFASSTTSKIHLGYTSDTLWLKFKIDNPINQTIKKVLVLDNQMLDHITLFTKRKNSYKKEILGVLNNRKFSENILDFYFNIELKPYEEKEFYLKVSSLSCAVYFTLELMDKTELLNDEFNHQLILIMFFSSIATLIIYNLFIYFFTRDITYVYYLLYLLFTIWNHLSYVGMGLYFLPQYFTEIDAFLSIFYLSFITIFALLFSRSFLHVKKYKKIDYTLKSIIALNLTLMLITSPEFYPIDIVVAVMFGSFLFIVGVSYYLFYKKEQNAKFFIVGWSIAILGWLMLATLQYGVYSLINTYPYFYEFAIFVEAILFSIALSSKLNKTKELENSLNTSKVLSRELHHRVKNNMQFIISLYRLKLNNDLTNNIDSKLKEVENSIKSMSSIHEILYERNDLQSINAQEYFTTLLDELKSTYKNNPINVTLNSTTATIDIQKSIYCGLILNELVTNSFKYAFDTNKGDITISIIQDDKNTILTIQDDGKGYDTLKESSGFGLVLVNSLVKNELQGTIKTLSDNGSKYQITF